MKFPQVLKEWLKNLPVSYRVRESDIARRNLDRIERFYAKKDQ